MEVTIERKSDKKKKQLKEKRKDEMSIVYTSWALEGHQKLEHSGQMLACSTLLQVQAAALILEATEVS